MPPSKLVLAFPWFAYDYACQEEGQPPAVGAKDVDWCHVSRADGFRNDHKNKDATKNRVNR